MAKTREIAVLVTGVEVGRIQVSKSWRPDSQQIEFLVPPSRQERPDGSFILVWMELNGDDVTPMEWEPETPDEITDANAIYEIALLADEVGEDEEVEDE